MSELRLNQKYDQDRSRVLHRKNSTRAGNAGLQVSHYTIGSCTKLCKNKLELDDTEKAQQYQQVIGSLMYVMLATRPDLA